jgi:hypothetical protein
MNTPRSERGAPKGPIIGLGRILQVILVLLGLLIFSTTRAGHIDVSNAKLAIQVTPTSVEDLGMR